MSGVFVLAFVVVLVWGGACLVVPKVVDVILEWDARRRG
jgi:hypothetical protein